eukprot:Awhi_evm1s7215
MPFYKFRAWTFEEIESVLASKENVKDNNSNKKENDARSDSFPFRFICSNVQKKTPQVLAIKERLNQYAVEWMDLPSATFKQVLRNIPNFDTSQDNVESFIVSVTTLTIHNAIDGGVRHNDTAGGPILVLSNLKYRGNIGTIIRSAVQAEIFQAVYIVGSRKQNNNNCNNNTSSGE